MKMVGTIAFLICGLVSSLGLASTSSTAAVATPKINCPQLISDLHEMRKAQGAMMKSFVQKNETIADALDHMAKDQRNLNGLTLKRSAQTFRQHKAREAQLVSRFEAASDQLLSQIEQCLIVETRLSANK